MFQPTSKVMVEHTHLGTVLSITVLPTLTSCTHHTYTPCTLNPKCQKFVY